MFFHLTSYRQIGTVVRVLVVAIVAAAVGAGSLAQPTTPESQAGRNNGSQGRKLSLTAQLQLGLKATTKADFAFIDKVVALVDQGKLPRRLVDSTFLWARQRAKKHRGPRRLRPMVYFVPGLTFRARALGVAL